MSLRCRDSQAGDLLGRHRRRAAGAPVGVLRDHRRGEGQGGGQGGDHRRAPTLNEGRSCRTGRLRSGRPGRIEWPVVVVVHSIGADLTFANGREPGEVDSRADLHEDRGRRDHGPPRRRAGSPRMTSASRSTGPSTS